MMDLYSKGVRQIFVYFMTNPGRTHHLRELSTLLSMDPGNLSREMKRLTEMGLFTVSEKGRLKLFTLNQKHPLFKEIRGLILKTEGAPVLLRKAFQDISEVEKAFIYGSFAGGRPDAQSDIDLMVVGTIRTIDLVRLIRPLEKKLGREIHYRIFNRKEFENRLKKKDFFLANVMSGRKIPIKGPE
ncbi:MAG: nucleotidyltransferase domain-containing protein [Deltaproteobacteria bacterium]|nr:nucleotidyltransferase domain-containing protein [Deltaproteobacteria bacterium]